MAQLPDLIAPGLKVLFCGINPGACAAERGHHFLGRGNRFWRVLHLAGFTPALIDARDDRYILDHGCGITAAVSRPTTRASELDRQEFELGKAELVGKLERYRPAFIAFLGKPAFEAMFNVRAAPWGLQAESVGATAIWIVPNPSGLNRGFSLDDLVRDYAALRRVAFGESGATAPGRSGRGAHRAGGPAANRTCGPRP